MKEITLVEMQQVSGSGIIGDLIIDSVKITNDVLNTSLVSSVGKVFDAVGLGSIHHLADSLGFAAFKAIAGVGKLFGGKTSKITYHYNEEWGS